MFKSSENLRLAAEMRALERVARPWREVRVSWFDGTPESIEARLAATERVLTYAKAGVTEAHIALEREASTARAELKEASHRLMVDFLDDGARAFKGSKRVAKSYPEPGWEIEHDRRMDFMDWAGLPFNLSDEDEDYDEYKHLTSDNPESKAHLYDHPEVYEQDPDWRVKRGSYRIAGDGDPMLDHQNAMDSARGDQDYRDFMHQHLKDTGPGIGDDDDEDTGHHGSGSRYFNEEGEPLMSGSSARFEDYLDDHPDAHDSHYGDDFGPDYDDYGYDEEDADETGDSGHDGPGNEDAHLDSSYEDRGMGYFGSSRTAGERGLRECINCGGALSGEQDDDKESECGTCGMSAHEKGVDWRKKSHRTASEDTGFAWKGEQPGDDPYGSDDPLVDDDPYFQDEGFRQDSDDLHDWMRQHRELHGPEDDDPARYSTRRNPEGRTR